MVYLNTGAGSSAEKKKRAQSCQEAGASLAPYAPLHKHGAGRDNHASLASYAPLHKHGAGRECILTLVAALRSIVGNNNNNPNHIL